MNLNNKLKFGSQLPVPEYCVKHVRYLFKIYANFIFLLELVFISYFIVTIY